MKKIILTLLFTTLLINCGSNENKLIRPPDNFTCEEIYEGCSIDASHAPDWLSYYGRLGRCENDFRQCNKQLDAGMSD